MVFLMLLEDDQSYPENKSINMRFASWHFFIEVRDDKGKIRISMPGHELAALPMVTVMAMQARLLMVVVVPRIQVHFLVLG